MWFPKPNKPEDLEILGPGDGLTSQQLFELLWDQAALEWKEKVGVVTPADGSAKPSTRLLKSGEWVFKTDLHRKSADKTDLRVQLRRLMILAIQAELWHPDKFWFLMTADEGWWPVSACPLLTTIRSVSDWESKIRWWSQMIAFGLRMSQEHEIGLDLNPSNFAFTHPEAMQLYYLDDEFYGRHDCFDVAEAAVARLPEDASITPEQWQQWGLQLSGVLQEFCHTQDKRRRFLDGIREYPLTPALEEQRRALLRGLQGLPTVVSTSAAISAIPAKTLPKTLTQGKRFCVFADVHGNFPALQAVIKAAKQLGAESFLFLGDVVSYGPFPHECIELLANMDNIVLLRGNHDQTSGSGIPENGSNRLARELDLWTYRALSQTERAWLLSLPVEYREDSWLAVHGAPLDPQRFYAYIYEMTYKENLSYLAREHLSVCFYGHTHVQFIHRRLAFGEDEKLKPKRIEVCQTGEQVLLNPGSVGQPRDGDPRAAFALWDRGAKVVHFYRVAYPVAVTVRAIKKEGLPEDLIYRLEVGR